MRRTCLALPAGVSIAALNGPKLVVVAGTPEAVAAYEAVLTQAGIGARRLQTSHAFHSAMMEPMLPEFRTAAAAVAFKPPTRSRSSPASPARS